MVLATREAEPLQNSMSKARDGVTATTRVEDADLSQQIRSTQCPGYTSSLCCNIMTSTDTLRGKKASFGCHGRCMCRMSTEDKKQ